MQGFQQVIRQQLALISRLTQLTLEAEYIHYKFGTPQANKNSELWHPVTTKAPMAVYAFSIFRTYKHYKNVITTSTRPLRKTFPNNVSTWLETKATWVRHTLKKESSLHKSTKLITVWGRLKAVKAWLLFLTILRAKWYLNLEVKFKSKVWT